MEIKKSEKANLENKKLLFIEIGLILSLLIVYVALEWTSKETNTAVLEDNTEILIEEEIMSRRIPFGRSPYTRGEIRPGGS